MFGPSFGPGRPLEIVDRLYHRQMYIDLVSAYLRDYGSRAKLARALGITEGAISQLLSPASLPDPEQHRLSPDRRPRRARKTPRHPYWADLLLEPPPGDLASSLSLLKTPNRERAEQIAGELRTEGKRRERLLYHMAMARRVVREPGDEPAYADEDEVVDRLRSLGTEFESALYTGEPMEARIGYAHVWDVSSQFLEHIDPVRQPIERVQVLLMLQDAASVLNESDRALEYARRAILLLSTDAARRHPMCDRFLTNAMLAEVVSLNELGLADDARDIADHALAHARYQDEPHVWRRSFLEQRLKSLSRIPGNNLFDAEATADEALALAPEGHGEIGGINAYLVQMYVRRGLSRSLGKAGRLIDSLRSAAASTTTSTVRRMRMLRAIAAYAYARHDEDLLTETVWQALELSESAGLLHEADSLMRWLAMHRWSFSPQGGSATEVLD
jgi:hypothetical protein